MRARPGGFFFLCSTVIAACASSTEPPIEPSATSDAGADGSSAVADASSPVDTGAPPPPSDAGKDTGTSGGEAGTCLAPKQISAGFFETGTTSGASDTTEVGCGAPAPLPEAVYRVVLAQDAALKITAKDASGQGVGVQVREDSCDGASVECAWAANGDYEKTLPLPAGTWFFIVERAPAGSFSLALEEL